MHPLLWLVLLFSALPLAGILYQLLGAFHDRRRFLQLGTLVAIGPETRLFVSREGTGGPTVVFESGIAATSQNWTRLQESVSAFASTISYDRAGLGWSSPSTSPRTPSHIVGELRLMLLRSGISPPYILVGHSFGGLVVRHFAALYPEEAAAVVLLDPMRPEEWPPVNLEQSALLERGIRLAGMGIPFARFGLARLAITSLLCRSGRTSRLFSRIFRNGGLHVLERVSCEVGKMPRAVWPVVAAHWSSPAYFHSLRDHLRAVPDTVREMHDALPIAGVPVLLLTPTSAEPLSTAALSGIGPAARQIIAQNSAHWVHLDRHDLVLEAIRSAVQQARVTTFQPLT